MTKSNTPTAPRLGFDAAGQPLPSEALVDVVRAQIGDQPLLVSFSCGKDSIASWLWAREHGFKCLPYFLYWIPGLSFVDRALTYYEDYFETPIVRLPHPLFYEWLNKNIYQTPERIAVIRALGLPNFDFADVDDILALHYELDRPFTAIGMRAADNIDRRNLIMQKGPLGTGRRRYYYPVWDWNIDRLADYIVKHKVKLPLEYKYWGRTLAAFDYQYLKPLKEHFPADYERIKEWFPLIDLELFRYEVVGRG